MATHIIIPRRSMRLFVTIAILFVAAGFGFIYLPRAEVTIIPKSSQASAEQTITLSSSAQEPDFVRYILPARIIEQDITRTRTITREGAKIIDDYAKGSVILKNDQDEDQSLLPKSHLKHDASGVLFLTDAPVKIPAHGDTAVTVTAKEKGISGNVPAGRFSVAKLPASTQKLVYGESKQDFTGGVTTTTPLSEEEVRKTKEELIQEARKDAIGELTLKTGGATVLDELTSSDTLTEHISAKPGSNALDYNIATTVRARAFAIDENDLLSLTLLALRAKETEENDFVAYDPDSFKVSVEKTDFERGEALVKGALNGSFARNISPTTFSTDNLAGLTAEEIAERFKQFDTVGDVQVRFWPFWVKSAPSMPGRIKVVVQQDTGRN